MSARKELAAVWPPTAQTAAQAGHKRMSPMQALGVAGAIVGVALVSAG